MQNKVAIVTGAAGGIGRGIAEVLIREGCRVAIADIDEENGRLAAAELTAGRDPEAVLFVRADMSREDDIRNVVERAAERWGTVDILANNVGTHFYKSLEDITAEAWDRVMTTDLRGYFLMIQNVLPMMKQRGSGAIVNIASVHAMQTGTHHAAYAAVKGGVVAMTRAIALECAPWGIRVNAVLPGMTRNANFDRWISGLPPEQRADKEKSMAHNIPLGRIAEPAEIGEAVAFLASPKASFITGSSLVVDGGETSHLHWKASE